MEDQARIISSEFDFEPHYVEVLGSKMHYIDEGDGDPILFLHGNPTSSYLWCNIIPYFVPYGRCIALDLIGMGKSEKPDIPYRFGDHYGYVDGFIKELELKNITLVIHDWGSGLGFHYATQNQDNVKAIAFMESILMPSKWSEFPPDYKTGFKLFRTYGVGWFLISVLNVFVEKLLPKAAARKLTQAEMDHYRAPFPTISSRKPVRQWPREIPIDGNPPDVHKIVSEYNQKLQEMHCPKILFYAHPGGLITESVVEWCQQNLKNLTVVDIGEGVHYVQESSPHQIGQELAKWYQGMENPL